MQKIKILSMYCLVSLMVGSVFFGYVKAQGNNTELSQDQQEKQIDKRYAQKEQRLRERGARSCELTQSRLSASIEKLEVRQSIRNNRYQLILSRLDRLALRLENNDLDASKLRVHIVELSDHIAEFSDNFSSAIRSVRDAANTACAAPFTLPQSLKEIRDDIVKAKKSHTTIEQFVTNDVENFLFKLRTQINNDSAPTLQQQPAESKEDIDA